jgi:cellulose synthase/poly-beta-1,6-N-acetylglucosamine synthase-like glycosyltransferase
MFVFELVLVTFAGLILVLSAVLLVEVLLALLPAPAVPPSGRRPAAAVLMPAHDEAPVIARAIAAVLPQLGTRDRLVVVADNCTDRTAELASLAGAEVIERVDSARRGKSYALEFGLRWLEAERAGVEVVVVVDADCRLAPGALDRLVVECARSGRPVQASYRMRRPPGAGWEARIAEFAWIVKNVVRPRGAHRAGMPCLLNGTGMALPWGAGLFGALHGELCEDYRLAVEQALQGRAPMFCEAARVTSTFPKNRTAASGQRRRWEHGHLSLLATTPRLLLASLLRRDLRLLGLALHLAVPPLAFLALATAVLLALGIAVALAGGTLVPAALAVAATATLAAAVGLAWMGWGRRIVSMAQLLAAPLYASRKLPLYARFLVARQQAWVKTARD